MFNELFLIAIRNVWRNRRRSVLNVVALSVGMTIMIVSIGWVRGYFTTLYTGMMNFDTGQVQVLHSEYLEEERRVPLDLLVNDYQSLRGRLLDVRGVVHVSGRIRYEAEVGNGREYMPMVGRAIDPLRERKITTLQNHLVAGRFLKPASPGVLLGFEAAERLALEPGDTVFVRVRDRYGAPNTTAHPVVGVFRIGYPLFDRNLVLTDLRETAEFLRTDSGVTHVVVGIESDRNPVRVARTIDGALDDTLKAYPWQRFARTMVAAVEADRGAFYLLMGILFLLILLGILNSMSMAVQERNREIGTMRAIGLKRRALVLLLLAESTVLAVVAAAVASVLGGMLAGYVQIVGFDIAGMMPADLPIPFGDRFHGDYRTVDFIISTVIGIATAIAGSLLPARRAIKIRIAETMRAEGV